MKKILLITWVFLAGTLSVSFATTFTSAAGGDWATPATWTPSGNPDTGDFNTTGTGIDSVIIDGHAISVNGDTYGGADGDPANDRFTVSDGQTVTIRGGGSLTFTDSVNNQHAWVGRRNGHGTINIESGSLISGGVQQLRIGSFGSGQGTVVVGDGVGAAGDATIDMGGQLIYVRQDSGAAGSAHMVINSDGQVINARFTIGQNDPGSVTMNGGYFESHTASAHYIGQNAGGVGTLTMNGAAVFDYKAISSSPSFRIASGNADGTMIMNGTATFNMVAGADNFMVGHSNNSQGYLVMNDNAKINISNGSDNFYIGFNNGSSGTMIMNGNSSIVSLNNDANSGNGVVVGRGGHAYLEINDNASIITESSIGLASSNSGSGDVVAVLQNGGTVSARYDLFVGRFGDASYTLTDGTVSVRDIRLGYQGGTGTFTQHGGTVTATGRDLKMSEHPSQTTGNGVYNLLGGTLRVDRIDLDAGADNPVDGVFNWGGGTLTMRNPNFNQGGGGTIDYTTTDPINGIGQIVRSGTTIEVTGDMSTATAGISTLDLGGVYLNDGTRVDIMEITGTLDLTGIDHLISVDSPNLLRPIGGSAIDYGSIPLVTATGGITGGSFNTFAAPMADGRPFYASPFAVSDPANLKPNTFYIETTGDTVWFHYKVTGTIPEPGTGMLLGLGVLMARGLHRLRRKDPA